MTEKKGVDSKKEKEAKRLEKEAAEANQKRIDDAVADPTNLQTPTELGAGGGEGSISGEAAANSSPA